MSTQDGTGRAGTPDPRACPDTDPQGSVSRGAAHGASGDSLLNASDLWAYLDALMRRGAPLHKTYVLISIDGFDHSLPAIDIGTYSYEPGRGHEVRLGEFDTGTGWKHIAVSVARGDGTYHLLTTQERDALEAAIAAAPPPDPDMPARDAARILAQRAAATKPADAG